MAKSKVVHQKISVNNGWNTLEHNAHAYMQSLLQ